ncbi:MAG: alpha/beta hydrolase-fold protein [Bacteroidia bacterium]|nr:alpha/beta hydrolase-fold protein [Bacteroidia bacterium]
MKKITSVFCQVLMVIAILTMIPGNACAQKLKPGPQDLSFFSKVDETDQPYAIYIPKNFDESKKYPLVVFLHGAWSNHRLGLRRAFGQGNSQGTDFIKPGNVPVEDDLEATRYFPVLKDVDYIVAAPYARGTAGYQGIPEQDVYEMLDDIKSRFSIDEDRIYLTGLSMGGGGTIWLGLTRPDIWAAIAPCCPAPPDGSTDLTGNACNLPVHLFVGDKDFLYKTAQEWKAKFEAVTPRFNYTEYPGIGHNSWEYAYKDGFIFEWFSQFTRDLFPQQVKFSTKWFKYNKAYWVKFDNLIPGTLATIDAKFTGTNNIEITTNGLEAFTLSLAGHSMFNPAQKATAKVDGKSFTFKTSDAVSFMKVNGTWSNKKFAPNLTSKQTGAEGPMYAAVSSNHVYVYGTGGNPSREELAARQAEVASLADWSGMGGRIMVFPRVISDKEIRQSDYETSNLVLFGTKETNAIIEKFADKLPVHLNADAKDYGLVYIFPLNNHYVVVNSGLPWWTPAKQTSSQEGFSFMGSKVETLKKDKDFVLFKETSDNIITQGIFDNNWKLPSEAAAIMKATGVITVRE